MEKLLTLLTAVSFTTVGCVSSDEIYSAASANARVFASNADMQFIDCSSRDSDSDYYVTCTMKDSAGTLIDIECNYIDTGCKQKEVVPVEIDND